MKGINSNKAAVVLSVEVVLMRISGPQYHLITAKLDSNYSCTIFDCFEHPEYLKSVLKDVYKERYETVVDNIEGELGDLASEKEVKSFLEAIK